MIPLRVLGIGSPFGDDQLGWEVVKTLQQQSTLKRFIPKQLELAYFDRPGVHLLQLMQSAQTVFLVDAVKTGAAIGTLHTFQNKDIETIGSTLSSHSLGIAETLQLGAALQQLPETIILYGIEIDEPSMPWAISPIIQKAIKNLSDQIKNDIFSLLNPTFRT